MRTSLTPRLANPWPIQYEEEQLTSLKEISRKNHKTKVCKLARISADFLIRLTDLNGGQIPLLDQIGLRETMLHRAQQDSRRAR